MILLEENTLDNMDELICNYADKGMFDVEPKVLDLDDEEKIAIDGSIIVIPELSLKLMSATVYNKNSNTNSYEPDFCITLIYDIGTRKLENYKYYEQDGFAISLYNYLAAIGKRDVTAKYVCNLKCKLYRREQSGEQEK